MQKDIFNKVEQGMILMPNDLTADEKKQLYAAMTQYGASEAFAYTRFFRDGFAEWEIEGVWKAKIEYLRLLQTQEKVDIEVRCTETIQTEDGETYKYRHFYQVDGEERSFDITQPGDFWRFLGDVRRRHHFGEYMANLGMKSQTTVSKRFALDNWKDYELSGVRQVINSLFEQ